MSDTDDDSVDRAEWGLRRYVQRVALGLGVDMVGACCEVEFPANAYLALAQRLVTAPDRDVALLWEAAYGWCLGLESDIGEDIHVVAYLGGEQPLAEPETVVAFAKTLLAGQNAGQPGPPGWPDIGDLTHQLAGYAPGQATP